MKYLLDSDFLYALYKPDDSNNDRSKKLFLKTQGHELIVTNLVLQESTTLVARRIDMKNAKIFYESVSKIANKQITLSQDVEKNAWKLFLKQTKKGTSFIDCANLAVVQKYKLDGILSFDEFYPKEVRVK